MAEATVSFVIEQLASIILQQTVDQVRLVGDVDEQAEKLESHLRSIQAVLLDAEQKQVKDPDVRLWLDRLKHTSYDMEDVLDEWNTAIIKLKIQRGLSNNALAPKKKVFCFLPSPCFGFKEVVLRRDIAIKIKEINKKLEVIAKEREQYKLNETQTVETPDRRPKTTSFIDVSDISGRKNEKNALISKLLCESSEEQRGLQIISLIGLGGIGKTTLAQFAFNNDKVMNNFDARIWVCVSEPFDEFRIAKAIIENLKGSAPNLGELQTLLQHIHESIAGRKFLLALDDVWTEDQSKWEPFYHCLMNGLPGSKILITTRKESVVRMMKSIEIIHVKELSYEENWLLFEKLAFHERHPSERERLEEIGKRIVSKCKGLPLATKTIGSLLRFKRSREEWQHILDSEMWRLEEIERGLLAPMFLSYNDLPPIVKRCFSYCSIFPKDYRIRKYILINLWMAQGYLGLEENDIIKIKGEGYFDHLAVRSFFQEFRSFFNDCKMHDIVHDFAQYLSNNECLALEVHSFEDPLTNLSHEKVRHLMLKLSKGAQFPMSICRVKRLRSLVIDGPHYCLLPSDVLAKLFGELICLRAFKLQVRYDVIKEIPEEIGKLIHLRYLDLSGQHIEKLPESLCDLCNLQTLDITFCHAIELPRGMGKLVNLRDFINFGTHSLRYLPIGIERLTNLRRLSEFIVGGGGGDDRKACTLESLKELNHLRGAIEIRGLGRGWRNVTNVKEREGIEVLKHKTNLISLQLSFDGDGQERAKSCEDDELVLEALQLPPNLETLTINAYKGNALPSHLMTSTSLFKLKHLSLVFFPNCKHMHHMGELPFLELLFIDHLSSLKKVDNGFWGIEDEATSSTSSAVLFPKLKELKFWDMEKWEEWDYGNRNGEEDAENITFMPSLTTLMIIRCPKLKALPYSLLQRTTLESFNISRSPILLERYNKETGESWSMICHIPNIEMDMDVVQGKRFFAVVKEKR